jgi:hypothetical protein
MTAQLQLHVQRLAPAPVQLGDELTQLVPQRGDLGLPLPYCLARRTGIPGVVGRPDSQI